MNRLLFGAIGALALASAYLARGLWSHAGQSSPPVTQLKTTNRAAEAAFHERYKRTEPLIKDAELKMASTNYSQAESLLRQALTVDNTKAKVWLLLAEVCEKQNKQSEALKAYHELIYSDQKGWGGSINSDMTTRMRYVLALLRSNKWQEAVGVYDVAMKTSILVDGQPLVDVGFNPNRREVARLQAIAHLILGTQSPSWRPPSKTEQRQHLMEAVRLQPDMPMAQFAYGQMLAKEGKYDAAKAAFQKTASRSDGVLKAKAKDAYQHIAAWEGSRARPQ